MAFTYAGPGTPAGEVRFLTGDTDATDPLLTDEEIAYLLAQQPSPLRAAVMAAEAISARYAREADNSMGAVSVSASQRCEHYRRLAADLHRKARSKALPRFWFGGIRRSEGQRLDADRDLLPPRFRRDDDRNE